MQVFVIDYPNLGQETAVELLSWFQGATSAAAGAGSEAVPARIHLPPNITKDERRNWHRLAEKAACHSMSQVQLKPAPTKNRVAKDTL